MKMKKLKMNFLIVLVAITVLISGCIKVPEEKAVDGQPSVTTLSDNLSKIKSFETTDMEKIVYMAKDEIYVIDADGSHEFRVRQYDVRPFVFLPDGRSLSFESSLAAFDTSRKWSPDGKKIAYIEYFSPSGGSNILANTKVCSPICVPVIGGGTVLEGQIRVLTPHGTVNLTEKEWSISNLAWSPDDERIAYTSGFMDSNLYIVNANGYGGRILLAQKYNSYSGSYAWSPNGEKIAYVLDNDLYVTNDDGSKIIISKNSLNPIWSPDGNKIVYLCGDSILKKLCLKDFNRINIEVVLTEEKGSSAVWSPDGKKIFYMSDNKPPSIGWGTSSIYVVNADGTNKIKLTHGSINNFALSPDGKKIAYSDGDLYIMNVDGTNQIMLTDGEVGKFVWSPDSERIAFSLYFELCTYETPTTTPTATPTPTPTPAPTPVIPSNSHATIVEGGVITGGVKTVFGSCSEYSNLYVANIKNGNTQLITYIWSPQFDEIAWSPASRLIGVENYRDEK